MPTIITIVEGDGEVQAVPILIRRIAEVVTPGSFPDVPKPIRVRRDGILEPGEIERYVELAADRAGPDGRILNPARLEHQRHSLPGCGSTGSSRRRPCRSRRRPPRLAGVDGCVPDRNAAPRGTASARRRRIEHRRSRPALSTAAFETCTAAKHLRKAAGRQGSRERGSRSARQPVGKAAGRQGSRSARQPVGKAAGSEAGIPSEAASVTFAADGAAAHPPEPRRSPPMAGSCGRLDDGELGALYPLPLTSPPMAGSCGRLDTGRIRTRCAASYRHAGGRTSAGHYRGWRVHRYKPREAAT